MLSSLVAHRLYHNSTTSVRWRRCKWRACVVLKWIFCSFNTDWNLKVRDQWRYMMFHDDESLRARIKTAENAAWKKGKNMGGLCRNYSVWNTSHISSFFIFFSRDEDCTYVLRIDIYNGGILVYFVNERELCYVWRY